MLHSPLSAPRRTLLDRAIVASVTALSAVALFAAVGQQAPAGAHEMPAGAQPALHTQVR